MSNFLMKCDCKSENCPARKKCCFLPTEYHPDREGKVKILFVGQGGGSDEREKGRPFIGRAGQRLRSQAVLAMKRYGSIFGIAFSNTIRDNPEGNRIPTKEELQNCLVYLHNDIYRLMDMGLKTIMPLGKASTDALLKSNESISANRGKIFDYSPLFCTRDEIKIIPTYHPSYFNFQGIKFTPDKLNPKEELVIQDILKGLQ